LSYQKHGKLIHTLQLSRKQKVLPVRCTVVQLTQGGLLSELSELSRAVLPPKSLGIQTISDLPRSGINQRVPPRCLNKTLREIRQILRKRFATFRRLISRTLGMIMVVLLVQNCGPLAVRNVSSMLVLWVLGAGWFCFLYSVLFMWTHQARCACLIAGVMLICLERLWAVKSYLPPASSETEKDENGHYETYETAIRPTLHSFNG
jgi:hypothetical protein